MSLEEFRELFGVIEFGIESPEGVERGISIRLMDVFLGIACAVVVWALV